MYKILHLTSQNHSYHMYHNYYNHYIQNHLDYGHKYYNCRIRNNLLGYFLGGLSY